MRPIRGCPEKFRDSLTTLTATIPNFLWVFVPIHPMNVPTTFEVRSFTRSWTAPGYAHAPFSPKFLWAVIRIGPILLMYSPNLSFVALPVPEIIGGTPKKMDSPWIRHAPFSPKF